MDTLGDERFVAAKSEGEIQQTSGRHKSRVPPSPSDHLHGRLIVLPGRSSRLALHTD
jgi:hypothetical protein